MQLHHRRAARVFVNGARCENGAWVGDGVAHSAFLSQVLNRHSVRMAGSGETLSPCSFSELTLDVPPLQAIADSSVMLLEEACVV